MVDEWQGNSLHPCTSSLTRDPRVSHAYPLGLMVPGPGYPPDLTDTMTFIRLDHMRSAWDGAHPSPPHHGLWLPVPWLPPPPPPPPPHPDNTCLLRACQCIGFFPFGVGNGDEVGPLESDASTSVIHLDDPIAFFLRNQTDLYVS